MENIKIFIKSQKEKIEKKIIDIKQKITSNEYQVKETENMVITLTKNIDTTYEIFSPNALDHDNSITEIEKLNFKKNELLIEIDALKKKLNEYLLEKEKIDIAYSELFDIEYNLAESVNKSKKLIESESIKVRKNCNNETVKYMNYINEENNNFLKNTVLKMLDTMLNKQNLVINMYDIDRERTKLELYKLNEETQKIKNLVEKKMFHVKHLQQYNDNEKIDISTAIENYVKSINDKSNIKVEFNSNKNLVTEKKIIVYNLIEIINEAASNSIIHSNCSIVNIELYVDRNNDSIETNNVSILGESNNTNLSDISINNETITSKINEKFNDNEGRNIVNNNDNRNIVDNNDDRNIVDNNDNRNILDSNNDNRNGVDSNSDNSNIINVNNKTLLNGKNVISDITLDIKEIDINPKETLHEISQIDFKIDNTNNNEKIIIKITDNGDGFKMQDEKVLLSNGMYGISIMKYKSKLINANINIDSTIGIGTTVTIVY